MSIWPQHLFAHFCHTLVFFFILCFQRSYLVSKNIQLTVATSEFIALLFHCSCFQATNQSYTAPLPCCEWTVWLQSLQVTIREYFFFSLVFFFFLNSRSRIFSFRSSFHIKINPFSPHRFGCCADGVTAARGYGNAGCPENRPAVTALDYITWHYTFLYRQSSLASAR